MMWIRYQRDWQVIATMPQYNKGKTYRIMRDINKEIIHRLNLNLTETGRGIPEGRNSKCSSWPRRKHGGYKALQGTLCGCRGLWSGAFRRRGGWRDWWQFTQGPQTTIQKGLLSQEQWEVAAKILNSGRSWAGQMCMLKISLLCTLKILFILRNQRCCQICLVQAASTWVGGSIME